MKTLAKHGSYTIAILDARNYVVYDHTKPKVKKRKGVESVEYQYSYYSQLAHAVKEVARLTANEQADSLQSWLEMFRSTAEEITGVFSIEKGLVDQLAEKQGKTSSPRLPLAQSRCKEDCSCAGSCVECVCSDRGQS